MHTKFNFTELRELFPEQGQDLSIRVAQLSQIRSFISKEFHEYYQGKHDTTSIQEMEMYAGFLTELGDVLTRMLSGEGNLCYKYEGKLLSIDPLQELFEDYKPEEMRSYIRGCRELMVRYLSVSNINLYKELLTYLDVWEYFFQFVICDE